jgi:hypothetical protein
LRQLWPSFVRVDYLEKHYRVHFGAAVNSHTRIIIGQYSRTKPGIWISSFFSQIFALCLCGMFNNFLITPSYSKFSSTLFDFQFYELFAIFLLKCTLNFLKLAVIFEKLLENTTSKFDFYFWENHF